MSMTRSYNQTGGYVGLAALLISLIIIIVMMVSMLQKSVAPSPSTLEDEKSAIKKAEDAKALLEQQSLPVIP